MHCPSHSCSLSACEEVQNAQVLASEKYVISAQ